MLYLLMQLTAINLAAQSHSNQQRKTKMSIKVVAVAALEPTLAGCVAS